MRIAIISDLHANLESIEAFQEKYDELWILGDLVNYGPNPREAIEFARSHAAVVIRGNHDNAIGLDQDPRCSKRYREMARAMQQYTASVLSESDKSYLASLPISAARDIGGKRFVLYHATPADPLFEYAGPDVAGWLQRAESASANILLVGHTHLPFIRQDAWRTVVNPGSLGQPKTGMPRACYAVWDEDRIELRSYSYDFGKTIARIREIGLATDITYDLCDVLAAGGRLSAPLSS